MLPLRLDGQPTDHVAFQSSLVGARERRGALLEPPTIACLSSRLNSQMPSRFVWLQHLKAAVSPTALATPCLLTAPGTTCDHYLRNGLVASNPGVIVLNAPPVAMSYDQWRRRTSQRQSESQLWVSPPLASPPHARDASSFAIPPSMRCVHRDARLPLRDRLLLALCDKLYVIHLRGCGNLDHLLMAAFACGAMEGKELFVPTDAELVPAEIADYYFGLGAIPWQPQTTATSDTLTCRTSASSTPTCDESTPLGNAASNGNVLRTVSPIIPVPTYQPFLLHWTRKPYCPLENENPEQFLQRLLLASQRILPEPLVSLRQIVEQKRLLASSALNRNRSPVVCFTEQSLHEFAVLHRYRRHLRRWDFEPYGVGVAKRYLASHGARPVFYGTDAEWNRLPPRDRPWFQPSRGPSSGIDWTAESEWRALGDIDLSGLSEDDVFVFVSSEAEAVYMAQFADWPVAITPQRD